MKQPKFFNERSKPGLEDIARLPYPGQSFPGFVRFTKGALGITYLRSTRGDSVQSLWRQNFSDEKPKLLFDASAASTAPESLEEALLIERQRRRTSGISQTQRIGSTPWLLITVGRNLYRIHDESGEKVALTNGSEACLDPKISPDGKTISFVRSGELWTVPFEGGESKQWTSGEAGTTRACADYIAQEEMHRSSGYFWSPNNKFIALFEVDERDIPSYPIVHQGKDDVVVEHHHYPFAGADNPKVRLGVLELETGSILWFDWSDSALHDIYIPRVDWFPNNTLAVQTQNREQSSLSLYAVELGSGKRSLLLEDEQPKAWINLHNGFKPLRKSDRFLWLTEKSGFFHIALHNNDGSLVRDLTSGEWMVTAISSIDEESSYVYFHATKECATERHLYRVSFGDETDVEKLTTEAGWHHCRLHKSTGKLLDFWSSTDSPLRAVLRSLSGDEPARTLFNANEDTRTEALLRPELLTVRARDGERLHGALFRAQSGEGPRPLIVHVYGGPHAQRVQNNWTTTLDMRAQYWTQKGFHVLRLDNRGSANRGLAFEAKLRHETGIIEVQDQVDGVNHLIEQGLVEKGKVGIFGWSYGGYMACMALIRASETFSAAVSGAPVTHWDGYDTHYTERYMGLPKDNAEGYKRSSVLANVDQLEGQLLLVHGLIDENVHFRHTARLINALIEADKDYDLLLFPDERHMPRSETGRIYMERRITNYFVKHLSP